MFLFFGFIKTFFTSLFGYFLLKFSRKLGVGAASVLATVAATVVFLFCIKQILIGVAALISFPPFLAAYFGMLIPSNFLAVTSFIVSGRICRAAYLISRHKIDLMNTAS